MESLNNIFERQSLVGDQDTSTINNLDDYLNSLLNPFNNMITTEILALNAIKNTIAEPITTDNNTVAKLQSEDTRLKNKYTFIDVLSDITLESNDYISSLTTTKGSFINILNDKALVDSPLTRPILKTILDKDSTAITRGYVNNILTLYTLPTPIPNTKLYVNRTGTGFIWA